MKIVCGTDFSPNANEAARAAAAIAAKLNCPLELVHVADVPAIATAETAELAGRKLGQLGESLAPVGATIFQKVVSKGTPADGLLQCANPRSTRFVVVASVSKTAIQRWTLGSVAEIVATSCDAPTLVVRAADPLVAWARDDAKLKVFVAVDFTASSDAAILAATKLREIGPCEFVFGHVAWPPGERRRYGIGTNASAETSPFAEHALQRDLTKHITDLLGADDFRVRVLENWGRPDAALIEMARAEKAGLMVVGTRDKGPLDRLAHGSVSRGIVRHAPMNVVCVPGPASTTATPAPAPGRFDRVLAGTDFSDCGNRAVELAYAAVAPRGTVILAHVAPKPGAIGVRRKLRALVPPAAFDREVVTELKTFSGTNAGATLAEAAERLDAQLICLGTRGRSPLAEIALGSTVHEVARQTRKPILLAPAAGPGASGASADEASARTAGQTAITSTPGKSRSKPHDPSP